jgi:ribosomal protein L7/L12
MTQEQIIEAVKSMTVLELNDLVKASKKSLVLLLQLL